MGADACPVPEGKGSWLFVGLPMEKLATEAPVNGGRNSDGPKVGICCLLPKRLGMHNFTVCGNIFQGKYPIDFVRNLLIPFTPTGYRKWGTK